MPAVPPHQRSGSRRAGFPIAGALLLSSAFIPGYLGSPRVAAATYAARHLSPSSTPGCSPGAVEAGTEASLTQALATSANGDIICITANISVSQTLSVDDTSLTLEGASPDIRLDGGDQRQILYAALSGATDDTVTIRRLTLVDGKDAGAGGAIEVVGSGVSAADSLVLESVTIESSSARTNGGGLSATGLGYVGITDAVFRYNVANDPSTPGNYNGGGAWIQSSEVRVDSTTFSRNIVKSFSDGGALSVDSNDVSITDSSFTFNTAGRHGGALSIRTDDGLDDTIVITDTTLSDNSGALDGGAAYLYIDGTLTMRDVTMEGNTTGNRGGAVYAKAHTSTDSEVFLDYATVKDNEADEGGGLFVTSFESMSVDRSTLSSNDAINGSGGALWIYAYTVPSISRSTIADNTTSLYGGGVYAFIDAGPGGSRTLLEASTLANNVAGDDGGGLCLVLNSGGATILNSTITGNQSSDLGGGIYLFYEDISVEFTTITGNSAATSGGGIYTPTTGNTTITNSVIAANTAPTGADVRVDPANTTLTTSYSMFTSADAVSGATVSVSSIIFGNPRLAALADNGGPTLTMLPQWNSPIIAAGDPNWAPPPIYDQRGLPRDAGGRVNLGAVQGQGSPPAPPPPAVPPSAPRNVEATPLSSAVELQWEAPSSMGSFPITVFQVEDASRAHGCLVPSTASNSHQCVVDGLDPAREYTFRVRALNGAGWGPWSSWTSPLTPAPAPTVVITGTRQGPIARVDGVITGWQAATVVPWVRLAGQPRYVEGVSRPVVDDEGRFTWQRRGGKKTYVYVWVGDTRSNRVIIPAR